MATEVQRSAEGAPLTQSEGPRSRLRAEAERTTVFAIMSREVICLKPEMSVELLRSTLLENGISGAPVVDEAGAPIGIISTIDVVREQHERGETFESEAVRLPTQGGVQYWPGPGFHLLDPGSTVGEVMSRKVVTIHESTPILKAAELMARHHVHRLPVVSETGKVVGLVSSLDVLGWVAGLT